MGWLIGEIQEGFEFCEVDRLPTVLTGGAAVQERIF